MQNSAIDYYICNFSEKHIIESIKSSIIDIEWEDSESNTLVHLACKKNFEELFMLLSENERMHTHMNKSNKYGITPLHSACFNDNITMVKILVSMHAADLEQMDNDYLKPYEYALITGGTELIDYLISQGAKFDDPKTIEDVIYNQESSTLDYFFTNYSHYVNSTPLIPTTIYTIKNHGLSYGLKYIGLKLGFSPVFINKNLFSGIDDYLEEYRIL